MYNPKLKLSDPRPFVAALLLMFAAPSAWADYASLVLGDNPKAYYRLNDSTVRGTINRNIGTVGAAGDATNDLGRVRPFSGAIVGDRNRASFFDFTARSEVPWNAAINPPNNRPFTVEAWFYPASDQTATGQAPLANRYAPSGANRQGWVFFQRKPDFTYIGGETVGWNFRMYNENGGTSGLDVTSVVPYALGKWTHVVVTYEPAQLTNASIVMYIDGVAANTNVWSGPTPGYVANSNDHSDAPSFLAVGNYNNTAGTSLNPYFGGVDEVAIYTNKLTPAQILAHYQNATNANRSVAYDALIKSQNPVEYLRLDEISAGTNSFVNLGDVRSSGHATNTSDVRHPAYGALVGRSDDGAAAYHNRNGSATTLVPYLPENNPDSGIPFTFECWLRPMRDQQGGQCPVNNRWVGGTGRTGWVIFQRNPSILYPASEGHGWNFRMYSGSGSSGQDVLTDVDYVVGQWQHLVFTWEPQADQGDLGGNGNHTFQGVLTAYVNGQPAASNTFALYAANREIPESGTTPSDIALGGYNTISGLGSNPYEGDVDEVAFYNNYVLTPDQIAAHYEAGTNAHPATNYETLVLTAPFTGPERQGPKTYLHMSDPAFFPATNSGTLGMIADGNQVNASNTVAGPTSALYPGFSTTNTATALDGSKSWISLNNPPGLNIAGQISLEAWVKPSATQGTTARIISHGPQTQSSFLSLGLDGSITNTSQVFLRIEDGGATYAVGSASYDDATGITTTQEATATAPGADLGSTSWIHLVGTYDGANWRLYRNGIQIGIQASGTGALAVSNADWAIGSTGNGWEDSFAGAVDEVAIYNFALTAQQVKNHYGAGTLAARISISRAGNNVTITWPYGTLYEASNVAGPYTPVAGNPSSPFITPIGSTPKFYRF